jgi:NTE family protein
MSSPDRPRRVAIACQGGGSHTAFTAGVLKGLLREPVLRRYEVVGLSGTSGGAVCAFLAWYGLLNKGPTQAVDLLEEFWADNAATAPNEQVMNAWMIWASQLQNYVAVPAVSPYDNPWSVVGLEEFRNMLLRRVDFDTIAVQSDGSGPMLLIGAVDVLSGEFRTFHSRHERISVDAILASAAIPTIFRAVHTGGGTYWDGLFSQNPPVRELIDAGPDEIWVIQINPKERDREPTTIVEIADRRNELSGNLSLHQELHFIEKIDRMLDAGSLQRDGKYRPIVVRVIELAKSPRSQSLGTASKLNRDPLFLGELIAHGEARAQEFIDALDFEDAWRRRDSDAVMGFFADESELVSSAPFPDPGSRRGLEEIRSFLVESHMHDLTLDLTRKQVARDTVSWTVGLDQDGPGRRIEGRVEAQFRGRKVVILRLRAGTTALD